MAEIIFLMSVIIKKKINLIKPTNLNLYLQNTVFQNCFILYRFGICFVYSI